MSTRSKWIATGTASLLGVGLLSGSAIALADEITLKDEPGQVLRSISHSDVYSASLDSQQAQDLLARIAEQETSGAQFVSAQSPVSLISKNTVPSPQSPVSIQTQVSAPSPVSQPSVVSAPSPVSVPSPASAPSPVSAPSPISAPSPLSQPSPVSVASVHSPDSID